MSADVDRLKLALELRNHGDTIAEQMQRDPLSFVAAGASAGAIQRQYLVAAAVDLLIDIAKSQRAIAHELAELNVAVRRPSETP